MCYFYYVTILPMQLWQYDVGAYGSDLCGYVTDRAIDYLYHFDRIMRPNIWVDRKEIKRMVPNLKIKGQDKYVWGPNRDITCLEFFKETNQFIFGPSGALSTIQYAPISPKGSARGVHSPTPDWTSNHLHTSVIQLLVWNVLNCQLHGLENGIWKSADIWWSRVSSLVMSSNHLLTC